MIDLFAEPSKFDIAWSWVNAILPSDTTTAWGQALSIFATTLTVGGTLMLSYMTLVGIVQSAYSGKVLGERWHQIWTPIRIVLGFGLLIPMPNDGFSAIHFVMKDVVARVAVNSGNAIWNTFVSSVAGASVPILPASSGGSGVVLSLLEHEICGAVFNKAGDLWGWQTPIPRAEGTVSNGRVWWSYGPTCGSMSYQMISDRPTFSDGRRAAVGALVTQMRAAAKTYADAVAETSGINSSTAYINAIGNLTLPVSIVADIRSAGAEYDKAIAAAAKIEAAGLETTSRQNLVLNAAQEGWMSMGSYYRGLADISMLSSSMTNEAPEEQAPRTDSDFGKQIERAYTALRFQVSGEAERVQLSANDFTAAGDDRADFLTKLIGPMTRDIGVWLASTSADPTTDPMAGRIAGGQMLVTSAESAVVLGGVVMVGASSWIGEVLGANGAAAWFLDWAKLAIGSAWVIGALWAYVLPMLPTIYTYIAGCLFILSVMEGMIAGMLWCLTFLRADNEEFIGSAQKMGLQVLVNVTLRPSLAVLSMCGSFLFFPIAIRTLDSIWPLAFYGQTGGYVPGLSAIIVSLAMKQYLDWIVVSRGFGMIAVLPDRIASWVGVQVSSMGEGDHGGAAVAGAVAVANRSTPGAIPTKVASKSGGSGTGGAPAGQPHAFADRAGWPSAETS